MSYKLKQIPDDFIVIEQFNKEIKDNGKFIIVEMKKKGINTINAIKEIAFKLKINQKDIGFCGIKDRQAITTQFISLPSYTKEKISNVDIQDIELKVIGYLSERLCLGDHNGNKFIITARNLDENIKINNESKIPNYFGEQRFSDKNEIIGKELMQKNFDIAAKYISESNKRVLEHLNESPNDFIGALNKVPKKLITLFIHAYQSHLFNTLLDLNIKKKITKDKIHTKNISKLELSFTNDQGNIPEELPMIGFDTDDEEFEYLNDILKLEDIKLRNFISKQIPSLTCDEQLRKSFIELKDLKVGDLQDDKLNVGKKKVTLEFLLPNGSYATVAIRSIIR